MELISVENVVKVFEALDKRKSEDVRAVDGVSFRVEPGEFFTLLGPSGCGKTTTLRMVAGLAGPDAGRITIGDRVLFDQRERIDLPPDRRGLGMVFQSYAIWPNMTVFKNVAFPLEEGFWRRGRPSRSEITARVSEALGLVQLDGLEGRPATDLSGGQQQRLALARALVTRPDVLLLDEPLSNLDAKLRETMRFELKKIQRELGITTLYVTHDQSEALGLSNSIAVMNKGRVEQIGHPREIYNEPASRFVADFIGVSNFFDGKVKGRDGGTWEIDTTVGKLLVESQLELTPGEAVTLSVRPEHIQMAASSEGTPRSNTWRGMVEVRAFEGDSVQHQVRVGEILIRVQCNPAHAVNTGIEVDLSFPPEWCSIIPRQSDS